MFLTVRNKKTQKDFDNFWHWKLTLKLKFSYFSTSHLSQWKPTKNIFPRTNFWAKNYTVLFHAYNTTIIDLDTILTLEISVCMAF